MHYLDSDIVLWLCTVYDCALSMIVYQTRANFQSSLELSMTAHYLWLCTVYDYVLSTTMHYLASDMVLWLCTVYDYALSMTVY